jgi:hypothetical protein
MNTEKTNLENEKPVLSKGDVMLSLPSVDEAGVIAVNVASNVKPKLTAQEESMFIAGFQECVKYLSGQVKGNGA